jgi:hypothetical protein
MEPVIIWSPLNVFEPVDAILSMFVVCNTSICTEPETNVGFCPMFEYNTFDADVAVVAFPNKEPLICVACKILADSVLVAYSEPVN